MAQGVHVSILCCTLFDIRGLSASCHNESLFGNPNQTTGPLVYVAHLLSSYHIHEKQRGDHTTTVGSAHGTSLGRIAAVDAVACSHYSRD